MQKLIVNSFSGGIEKDLSINKYDNTHYYDAQNFTLITNKELSNHALNSIMGNLPKANISGGGVRLAGYATIRDTIILFVDNNGEGAIYRFIDDGTDFDDPDQLELIYTHPDLKFNYEKDSRPLPIYAIGRYENPDVQKVYFTDTENFFYHLNVIHNPLTNDLQSINKITPNSMELLSDVLFKDIRYSIGRGGNLTSGRIQYAYQFYNINGSETVISPTSVLLNLTASDDNANSTIGYVGSKQGTVVNKNVTVTIPLSNNTTFIRLRLIAIQYDSDIVQPSVRIVGEYNIKNLSELSITDTGQTLGTLTLEELRFLQQDFIPKTLETKDNILFAGDITTKYFHITDEQFDARAFRFDDTGVSILNQNRPSNEWVTVTSVGGTIVPETIPEYNNNCFNILNDLDQDRYRYVVNPLTNKKTNYRYKPDGTTLGGEGLNISYEFITIPKVIDTEPKRNNINVLKSGYQYPKQQVKVEYPFDNYSNYITSAEYQGYQRDEIYAFGIVFFDSKGRQSFVKWIGDIRFPDNNDMPFISYDSENQHTIANILGIKFRLTPQAITNLQSLGVTSYHIVRCERRDSDRTVKAAGVMAYPYSKSTESNSNKMYCVSTLPKIGDCFNKKIVEDRRSYDVFNPADNRRVSEAAVVLQKDSLSLTDRFIEFNSPEVSFEKKLNTTPSDFIEVNGYLNELSYTAINDVRASGDATRRSQMVSDKFKNFGAYPSNISNVNFLPYSRIKLNTSKVFTQIDNQFQAPYIFPDGKVYSKQAHNGKTNSWARFGLRGTHLFSSIKEGEQIHFPQSYIGGSGSSYDHRVMYGYYRQNPSVGIYNGTDYSSRLSRTYYKASKLIEVDQTTSTILQSSVVEVPPPDTETFEIIGSSNISVIWDNMSGFYEFVADLNVVAPAEQDVDFTLLWYINKGDFTDGPYFINITLPEGQTSATGRIPAEITEGSEGWLVVGLTITTMSSNNQYTIDPELGYIPPTQPTYTVTLEETEVDGIVVFGGDTYIDYHIDYRSFWDTTRSSENDTGRWSIKSVLMYPVESKVNLALRTDDIQGYIVWHAHPNEYLGSGGDWIPVNGPKYHLQETLRQGIQMWGVNYPIDFGDLYQYNPTYSAIDKTKVFVPEPFDFKETKEVDTRVWASDTKINGEYTDSWLKFKPNFYIDVDSQYGRLVRLLNVANRLLFFQPDGLGVLSVNERALVQDNNVNKVTLGSSGVLPRFDYLSYTTGILTHNAVVKADTTFFYVDAQRKRIYTHAEGDVPVSAVKGINSLLKSMPFDYVNCGFEPDFNRVYFTIDGMTLVYNEFVGAFTHTIAMLPSHYISLDNGFYTVENKGEERPLLANDFTNVDYNDLGDPILIADGTTGTTLYKHNINPTGILNGDSTTTESFVELIIHPEGTIKCSFDNIEFTMEVLNNNDEEVFTEETNTYQPVFDSIKQLVFSNSYMEKTVDIVYNKTIKKIGKTWRVQVPLVPDRKVPTRSTRFVDTYLRLKIIFDNSTANRLRLHDVITYYRPISV